MQFYQVVRDLLLRKARNEDYEPSGNIASHSNAKNIVRFSIKNTLAFPEKEISHAIANDFPQGSSYLEVILKGLTGAKGLLPNSYTSFLIDQIHRKETAAKDFFDIFNHQMVYFSYCVWEKNRPYICHERGIETLEHFLASLMGYEISYLKNMLHIPYMDIFYYSALFSQNPPNVINLETLLRDYFKLQISVKLFQDSYQYLSKADRRTLGIGKLGINIMLGERNLSRKTKFRLLIDSLDYKTFKKLLPDGEKLIAMYKMICLFLRRPMDFDMQLVLKEKEVPYCFIGDKKNRRLGWDAWLKTERLVREIDDAVFQINDRFKQV